LAPLEDGANSIGRHASCGMSARPDDNFDRIGVAWQYRWKDGW
jgi:hypothetical protein